MCREYEQERVAYPAG